MRLVYGFVSFGIGIAGLAISGVQKEAAGMFIGILLIGGGAMVIGTWFEVRFSELSRKIAGSESEQDSPPVESDVSQN